MRPTILISRNLACLLFLILAQAVYPTPKANPSDLVGEWNVESKHALSDILGRRFEASVNFHQDGTFDSTSHSVYYFLKTGKELVWTTLINHGDWTIDGSRLTFDYKKIDLDFFQSDFPTIDQAFMDKAIQEQLQTPDIHEIQSVSDIAITTISGERKIKYILRKSSLEAIF